MKFDIFGFNLNNPDSWLILLIFAGFWAYSYYSLIILLIHTRKQNALLDNEDDSLEITS